MMGCGVATAKVLKKETQEKAKGTSVKESEIGSTIANIVRVEWQCGNHYNDNRSRRMAV